MTASTYVDRLMLIDGAEAKSVTGRHFSRSSPAHDTPVASYPQAGAQDVDLAVRAARRAFDAGGWPQASGAERARVLTRVAELIRRDLEELARTEVLEGGKPIVQARGEMESTAALWEYAATLARHAYGEAHSMLGPDVLGLVLNEVNKEMSDSYYYYGHYGKYYRPSEVDA